MQENSAMRKLPPYLFARIEKKIEEAKEKGVDIISLGLEIRISQPRSTS